MSMENSKYKNAAQHLDKLKAILKSYQSVIVAYSGGVDSTFLCKIAFEVLGNNAIAVTARSSTYPARELQEARKYANDIGIHHIEIISEELDIPGFSANDTKRCFYCKSELYTKLLKLANDENITYVVEGSNLDDNGDYRPGLQAASLLGIKSPMREAGLTKQMIRILSQEMGLPTWNKPAFACLSSRFPYGTEITDEKLQQIDKAEQFLFDKGFTQVRVRHHGDVARIELLPDELNKIFIPETAQEIYEFFKKIGFQYIAADICGYRTGSLNEGLDL